MADNSLTPKEEFLLNPVTEHNITDAAIASFETNLRHPVRVKIPFSPVQAGTGDPSPDNDRPISGWTGAEITGTRKNLFGGSAMIANAKAIKEAAGTARPPIDETLNTIIVNATQDAGRKIIDFTDLKIKSDTVYTIILTYSKDQDSRASNLQLFYTDGSKFNIPPLPASVNFGNKGVVAVTTNARKTISHITGINNGRTTTIYCDESGLFEGVLTADDFVPYTGNTLPITFTDPTTGDPMTVYGGTVTLNEDGSVDVVEEWAKTTVGNLSWSYYNTLMYATLSSKAIDIQDQKSRIICDQYSTANPIAGTGSGGEYSNNTIRGNYNSKYIYIKDTRYTSAATFKSEQANAEIVYMLATPQTYHFPNVGQLKTFLGTNNVWSDIGNVNVKYLTQNSETGMEYRGDRALELRRRAMLADAPTIHTTVGSKATGGLASFKSYVKAPVKKIEIPFSPKQDLHGMPYPYPAGASVNLIPDGTDTGNGYVANRFLQEDGAYHDTATGSYYISEYFPVIADTVYTWSNTLGTENLSAICFYDSNFNYIIGYKAGGLASRTITTPSDATYARSTQSYPTAVNAKYQFELGSTATTYRRYSNICPIEGWTKTEIKHRGKNLFDINAAKISKNWDNELYQTFLPTVSMKPGLKITASYSGGRITASVPALAVHISPNRHKAQGPFLIHQNNSLTETSITVTLPSNGEFYLDAYKPASAINLLIDREMQIEIGSVRTTYEAYRGNQISVDWEDEAGIVYGGTITLNEDGSADVVRKYGLKTISASDNFGGVGTSCYMSMSSAGMSSGEHYWDVNAKCNIMKKVDGNYPGRPGIRIGAGDKTVYFYRMNKIDATLTTIAAIKAWLVENGCCFTFPLAAPTTYHFSNLEQLKIFLGENNFWCDISDDITVKYWNRGFGN